MIEVRLPYRMESGNIKRHHFDKSYKNKVALLLYTSLKIAQKRIELPASVTITREGPRTLDYDNFVTGAKSLRDNIANWLRPGLAPGRADDDEELIQWDYKQRKAKDYMVIVRIDSKKDNGH